MNTCRIMTYNIRHGQGMDRKVDLARIADLIVASGADLVALQEMDRETARVAGVDQVAELAGRTGMRAAFSKSIDLQSGVYGNAILSRFPILAERCCALPGKEPRSALACEVSLPGGDVLRFASTHLDLVDEFRVASAPVLVDFLADLEPLPTILCGDFNALPESETLGAFIRAGWEASPGDQASPSYPADEPDIRIDYILSQGLAANMVLSDACVIDEALASDHRPVTASLLVS
ncbi:MAG: hypothetical protein HN849_09430 [Victivallales bacterium]|jgi:endonuclease/exonuclease/phosphatase family metal-dependent hydrolase|nr:hypothetical protein [Victivallales bacterium]